jgi:glutamate carboxypeptidase
VTASSANGAADLAVGCARWLAPRRDALLALVRDLVDLDTPSGDVPALARAAALLRGQLDGLVRTQESRPTPHGDHLIARLGPAEGRGPLVLCHYDTVWPDGTARERRFALDGEHATGPGVFDMKASIAMAVFALRAIDELSGFAAPVTLSLTPDEEIGNPSTRATLEELAREASTILVLEPPLPGGALKTRRKGIAKVRIEVTGIPAHAGLDPDAGASAALEVAHLVLAASQLGDASHGTTVNVGMIRAGDRRNVVAAGGEIEIDVRGWDEDELQRVLAAVQGAAPTVDGARIRVESEIHRPPMIRDARIDAVLDHACAVASALGTELSEGEAGGGSEANLTSPFAPTLDGLGPEGEGAHGYGERVVVDSLLERTALLAGILAGDGGERR